MIDKKDSIFDLFSKYYVSKLITLLDEKGETFSSKVARDNLYHTMSILLFAKEFCDHKNSTVDSLIKDYEYQVSELK